MNNRIKELAKEAGLISRKFSFDQWWEKELSDEQMKFAELIINECVDQCMSDDYKNILNHFGMPIEEDEELDDGCPCGYDGGTSCGSQYCFLTKQSYAGTHCTDSCSECKYSGKCFDEESLDE